MAQREQLYAELPLELREADELLHKYGRWARDKRKLHSCGSAERAYRPPQNDEDRQPREILIQTQEAARIREALNKLQPGYRIVLMWLYIPSRVPIQAKMRKHGIHPRLMRERHASGVQAFWTEYKHLTAIRMGGNVQAPEYRFSASVA